MQISDNISGLITKWLDFHAVAILVAVAITLWLGALWPVVVTTVLSFALLLILCRNAITSVGLRGNAGNLITLGRLSLLAFAFLQLDSISARSLFIIFAINLVLDVVDGIVARRLHQASLFGTVFDRETDAIYVLVAYYYFYLSQVAGIWLLVPGLLPYAYRIWLTTMKFHTHSEQRQISAAILAGCNFVLLLIAVVLPNPYRLPLLIVSTSIVVVSFAISIIRLVRAENEN